MQSLRADNPDDQEQMRKLMEAHVDITGAKSVQVTYTSASMLEMNTELGNTLHLEGVMWVNVNGICILRICNIKE